MIGKLDVSLPGTAAPTLQGIRDWLKARRLLAGGAAVLIIAALVAGMLSVRARGGTSYATQPVQRTTLTQSVTASGTVNPQNTISVGTQASGTISQIYVDYNSKVKKGQILARIDPTQIQAQLAQAQANLAQAQAQAGAQNENAQSAQSGITVAQAAVETAQANLAKAQSAAQLANQTVTRDQELLAHGYISQSQYDTDQNAAEGAQAGVEAAQAASLQARAQGSQSQSQAAGSQFSAQAQGAAAQAASEQVAQDQYNLDHTVITSPVDGTVIARNVSVGQTVASSFQTPTLFSIAQNLKKMEVDIAVGEPDIGNVKPGEDVSFTVLAYPNQTFKGVVSQVRVDPTTVNNVVTYDVVTLVNNPNEQLLPGMTANASITVATAKNALVVPQQALSFNPAGAHVRSAAGSAWGQIAAGTASSAGSGSRGRIYVQRNGKAVAVPVRIDLSSGTQAAVTPLRGTLNVGDAVIVGSAKAGSSTHAGSASHAPSGMGIGRAIR